MVKIMSLVYLQVQLIHKCFQYIKLLPTSTCTLQQYYYLTENLNYALSLFACKYNLLQPSLTNQIEMHQSLLTIRITNHIILLF